MEDWVKAHLTIRNVFHSLGKWKATGRCAYEEAREWQAAHKADLAAIIHQPSR